jgi:hypothetical protein
VLVAVQSLGHYPVQDVAMGIGVREMGLAERNSSQAQLANVARRKGSAPAITAII